MKYPLSTFALTITMNLIGKITLSLVLYAGLLSPLQAQNFVDTKKMGFKWAEVYGKIEDSVKTQFARQKLVWPPASVYVRSFKFDRELEVWVKNNIAEPFRLFKTYKVCMQSGSMGPKRMEGDYQVPEGFYHINDFNPNSMYHLSLGLNYPNGSDRILSDSLRPGNNIYIHGNCVSTGCIPISDYPIEELFVITSASRDNGQEFIPVHVFPVRYNVKKSIDYLNTVIQKNEAMIRFNKNIRNAFDYFEARHQLPLILVNKKGEYVFE